MAPPWRVPEAPNFRTIPERRKQCHPRVGQILARIAGNVVPHRQIIGQVKFYVVSGSRFQRGNTSWIRRHPPGGRWYIQVKPDQESCWWAYVDSKL